MEDLVGIGVADPAEDRGIGQHALERMVLGGEGCAERREIGLQHLEAPGIVLAQGRFAPGQVDGRALLRARLGHEKRPRRAIQGGHADLARDLRPGRLPVQAPGDHEVEDHEELVVQLDDDPLAQSPQATHGLAADGGEGRVDGAQHEGAGEPDALEPGAEDARPQRLDVDGDVRELRHPAVDASGPPPPAAMHPSVMLWP